MTIIKKWQINIGKDVEKSGSSCTVNGKEIGAITGENSMMVSQKKKNKSRITMCPSHSTPGCMYDKNENTHSQKYE